MKPAWIGAAVLATTLVGRSERLQFVGTEPGQTTSISPDLPTW